MSVVSRTSRRTVEAIRPPTGTQPRALSETPNAELHSPSFGEFLAEFRQDYGQEPSDLEVSIEWHEELSSSLDCMISNLRVTQARMEEQPKEETA